MFHAFCTTRPTPNCWRTEVGGAVVTCALMLYIWSVHVSLASTLIGYNIVYWYYVASNPGLGSRLGIMVMKMIFSMLANEKCALCCFLYWQTVKKALNMFSWPVYDAEMAVEPSDRNSCKRQPLPIGFKYVCLYRSFTCLMVDHNYDVTHLVALKISHL